MNLRIRRLGQADASVLARMALDGDELDTDGRIEVNVSPSKDEAEAYLMDPSVLHWVAEEGEAIVGDLHCQIVRKHGGASRELLLYDIGVRSGTRRHGVGRALVAEMFAWMKEHDVVEVWVLADNPGATAFYQACGFEVAPDAPVYLVRNVE